MFSLSHRRLKASSRRALFGLMVVYGIATVFVPFADSLLETAAHEAVEHFEEVSPPCGIGHDQLTCPLCPFVGLASVAVRNRSQFDLRDSQPISIGVAEALPRTSLLFSPLGPRGPPPA